MNRHHLAAAATIATLIATPNLTHAGNEPIGDVCHINGTTHTIPTDQFELTPTESVGTHSITGMWCKPITPIPTTIPEPVCIWNHDPNVDVDNFVIVDPTPNTWGTHDISGMPCNPTTPPTQPQAAATNVDGGTPPQLPETGTETVMLTLAALLTLIAGIGLYRISRPAS